MRGRVGAWFGALALAASAGAARAEPPVFADTLEQRLQACTGCHGERGGGVPDVAFPRLAGQPADYLAAQMKAFRDGQRRYAPMNFLMARQSDAYFAEIAEWFAAQTPDPRVVASRRALPVERAAVEAGERLAHAGRPEAKLPACAACHGAGLAGSLGESGGAIPALAGLPRDFLIEQVGSWKNGSQRSPAPDCMAEIARRLSSADIVAAATWLSLQAPEGRPARRTAALPIDCGMR